MFEYVRFALALAAWPAIAALDVLQARKDRIWLARAEAARIAQHEGE